MTDPTPPPRLSPSLVAVQLGCLALLLWLYGGDLADGLRLPGAEVAAFVDPPNLAFSAVALLAALAAAGAAVYGHLSRRGADWKPHRLLPIAALVLLFADLLVMSSARSPMSAPEQAALGVQEFARRAHALATAEAVPASPDQLRPLFEDFVAPPFFEKGVQVPRWGLEVKEGCEGPATQAAGARAGTFLYCVSGDKKAAWVTLVGLPWGTRFGSATVFAQADGPVVGEVAAHEPEAAPEGEPLELPGELAPAGPEGAAPGAAGEPALQVPDSGATP